MTLTMPVVQAHVLAMHGHLTEVEEHAARVADPLLSAAVGRMHAQHARTLAAVAAILGVKPVDILPASGTPKPPQP